MNKKYTLCIILFLLILPVFPYEENEWVYELLQNNICSKFEEVCKFEITSDYPTSPFISYYFTALIDANRYFQINIKFNSDHPQRFFYQETYDASTYSSLVLGGDVDIVNCTGMDSCSYYIELIGGTEDSDSFQINFLGLPDNFSISVEIEYPYDVHYSIQFGDWQDAVKISEDPWLINYFKERQKQIESFNERRQKVIEKATSIIKNLFGDATFSIQLPNNGVLASEIYVGYNFIATVTVAVSTYISAGYFLQDKETETITSEKNFIQGKFYPVTDGINLLDGNINLNSDIIRYYQLFTQKLEELMFSVEFYNDIFSVIISFNPLLNSVIITMKFYEDIEMIKIAYEIQIKIVPTNLAFPEAVQEYEISKVNLKKEVAEGAKVVIVTAAVTGAIMLTLTFAQVAIPLIETAAPGVIATVGAAVGRAVTSVAQSFAQLFQTTMPLGY